MFSYMNRDFHWRRFTRREEKVVVWAPGDQSCFKLVRRPSTNGFGVIATEFFRKGEKVLLGPGDVVSDARAIKLFATRGWTEDFGIWHKGAGAIVTDLLMPSFVDLYPPSPDWTTSMQLPIYDTWDLIPAEIDGGMRYPWRDVFGSISSVSAAPPPTMPLWYFLDHSHDPSLKIHKNMLKILPNNSEDERERANGSGVYQRHIVFEAAKDILPGEWLTFKYQRLNMDWVQLSP